MRSGHASLRQLGIAAAILAAAWTGVGWSAAEQPQLASQIRRPQRLVLAPDGKRLYVANRRSGSISVVDIPSRRIAAEWQVGRELSDLATLPGGSLLLATDPAAHELLVLAAGGDRVAVVQRCGVAKYPERVAVSRDGRLACVTSLWSRRVTIVRVLADALGDGPRLQVTAQLDLPFAPREQILVQNDRLLIVADAFGGRLAIVDPHAGRLLFVRELPAHNIRGLGLSPDGKMLVVAHQLLNELAHTVHNDVHWGLLLSNDLRWLRVDRILDRQSEWFEGSHMQPIGEAGRGGADPGRLVVAADGTVVVTVSGTDELAWGREESFGLQRMSLRVAGPQQDEPATAVASQTSGTGRYGPPYESSSAGWRRPARRPIDVVFDADSRVAYVAHQMADTIMAVDLDEQAVLWELSLGPSGPLAAVDRGERLFYDARLSLDGWMSCHSCHTDGHTNGMLNDNFSDGSFGAPKRVLSLLGRRGTEPLGWTASAATFAEQIRKSVVHTMQGGEPAEEDVRDLAAFLESLVSPPSILEARAAADAAAIDRGRAVFAQLRCDQCHAPPAYTSPRVFYVHTQDELGVRHFNPPSLLGVGQGGPYLHDGRAKTLEALFFEHRHRVPEDVPEASLRDLIEFLRSL